MQNNFVNRGSRDLEYAGFWVRLAAYCIDSAIVWAGLLFVELVIGIISVGGSRIFQAHLLFRYTLRDIILYVFQVLYFILLTYGTGTTPGKRLLNLRVVNADLSPELTLINVVYRETVGRFLCGLSVGIGYIMAGVDREKRGLHDMICDTRVVYAKKIKVLPKYEPMRYAPPISPPPGPGPGPVPMPPYGRPLQGGTPGSDGRYTGPLQGGTPGSEGRYAGPSLGPHMPEGQGSGQADLQDKDRTPGSEGRYAGPPLGPRMPEGQKSGQADSQDKDRMPGSEGRYAGPPLGQRMPEGQESGQADPQDKDRTQSQDGARED
jgi:uncharacterized RDD family membrane protein YckC